VNWKPISRISTALSSESARTAASKCGYDRPTIWIHPEWMGYAEAVANSVGYNVRTDPSLVQGEWFVEWNGERYGSDLEMDRPNPNMRMQEELPL
jgi:hypothetical protein